jgi:hypothetical protein
MPLSRKAIINKSNQERQQTTTPGGEPDKMFADWPVMFEDKTWRRILEALAARGVRAAQEEIKARQK